MSENQDWLEMLARLDRCEARKGCLMAVVATQAMLVFLVVLIIAHLLFGP